MNILGREFVAEQMPDGWVICEKWIDGVLSVIGNTLSNKKQAHKKLNVLQEYLVKHCQQLGLSAEQYWQCYDEKMLTQWMSQLQ
jgi:hypothetical protein